ncbi:MAG TPA: HD domain-containing phosphohydrolase [Candidatus Polarisedimenticolaceae bacterium]|nr:HD domain-containing phosphohydrolase [Candidatus Polarisedimenticolaceae bacterium]
MTGTSTERRTEGRFAWRPRARMVYLLLAVFSFVALAPLGTVAWKLIATNREALKTSQQEYQLLLASTVSRGVDIYVEGLRGQLAGSSRALGAALAGNGEGVDVSARSVLGGVSDDRVLYVRFTDVRGRVVDVPGAVARPSTLEPLFLAGFREAAETLEGRSEIEAQDAVLSDPLLLAGDPARAAIVMSAPVVSAGQFRGVVSELVDLRAVWDAVVAGHRTGHAVFAVDTHGRLFASTDLPAIDLGADMSSSPIVERFRDNPGHVTETMPFSWSREKYLGSYEVSREGWGIFVQATERQFYMPVSQMIDRTLQWGMLALACALLAAAVFARVLSEPIKHLAEASRAFARGEFGTRVAARSITEVAELAETFNHMAADLEEFIRRLRQAAEENNELFLGTARALASAIDAKDPYTRGHSVRVNRYSVILARYHGLAEQEIRDIHVASLLHDVGKIGVDDAILKKPGKLTPAEFEIMKMHTVIGATIMSPIRQMKRLLPGLRNHHERWAGAGYPDALAGDAIPLMARIIAVADSFDAMTTDRPYQKGMTFEAAVARVNELKGTAFDERIVASFNRAYQAGEFRKDARPSISPQADAEREISLALERVGGNVVQ